MSKRLLIIVASILVSLTVLFLAVRGGVHFFGTQPDEVLSVNDAKKVDLKAFDEPKDIDARAFELDDIEYFVNGKRRPVYAVPAISGKGVDILLSEKPTHDINVYGPGWACRQDEHGIYLKNADGREKYCGPNRYGDTICLLVADGGICRIMD